MEIRTEKEKGALIAKAQGRVDSANAREFQDALQATIGDDDRVLILDSRRFSTSAAPAFALFCRWPRNS